MKQSTDLSTSRQNRVQMRMKRLNIRESDIEESFIRGTGPGGQKINKTSSCVQLTHQPSGITVRCQHERNQSLNRISAREELCKRIETALQERKLQHAAAVAKSRRQKAVRSYREKQKILQEKKFRSHKKILRKKLNDH